MLTYFSNLSISLWATSICFWTRASSLLCSASICFWLWTFSWLSVKKKIFIDQTDTRFLRHILQVFVWLGEGGGGKRSKHKPFHFSKSSPFLDSSSLGGGIFGPSSETKVSPNASPPFLSVTSSVTMVRQTLAYTSSSSRITPTLFFLARQLWNNPMIYNTAV